MAARLPSLWEIMFIASIYATSMMLASGIAHAEPASPTSRTTSIHPTDRFADLISEASRRFDVPAHLLRAVMHLESGAHARALSPKGAMGLMQIMPATYATLRARYALGANPYDPRDNILAGAAYLREMLDRYGASGFLAAYNAGPRRYEEHLRTGRPLPIETQQYVAMLAPIIGVGQFDDRPLAAVPRAGRERASRRSVITHIAAGTQTDRPRNCRSVGPRATVGRPLRASHRGASAAMIQIALPRSLSGIIACSAAGHRELGDTGHGRQDKSADWRRTHVVGWVGYFWRRSNRACWRLRRKFQQSQSFERHRADLTMVLRP
jgi:hypothetical protein